MRLDLLEPPHSRLQRADVEKDVVLAELGRKSVMEQAVPSRPYRHAGI